MTTTQPQLDNHRTCPWCEGRKVTGQLVRGESGETLEFFGRKTTTPVVHLVDKPCGVCAGTGTVSTERHDQLTGASLLLEPEPDHYAQD